MPKKNKKEKKGGPSGLMVDYLLSEPLQEVVGVPKANRIEIMKRIWRYIKANHLQDPRDKRFFYPDRVMGELFGRARLRVHRTMKLITDHLIPSNFGNPNISYGQKKIYEREGMEYMGEEPAMLQPVQNAVAAQAQPVAGADPVQPAAEQQHQAAQPAAQQVGQQPAQQPGQPPAQQAGQPPPPQAFGQQPPQPAAQPAGQQPVQQADQVGQQPAQAAAQPPPPQAAAQQPAQPAQQPAAQQPAQPAQQPAAQQPAADDDDEIEDE